MTRTAPARSIALALLLLAAVVVPSAPAGAQAPAPAQAPRQDNQQRERKPQTRPHGTRVAVVPDSIEVDDGDTASIRWPGGDREIVRILGIDTPETQHVEFDLPFAQAFGAEARGFAQGAFAAATKIEILRSPTTDPYGRTLGYFFLNDRNYSVLVVRARLAEETVTRYGDNGLPEPAAEVMAAAKTAGPLPFESPGEYRRRMRAVSGWLKERGGRRSE
jgi:endonuclease YncB( thermonuclease family)